jgi:hypothetical protein
VADALGSSLLVEQNASDARHSAQREGINVAKLTECQKEAVAAILIGIQRPGVTITWDLY